MDTYDMKNEIPEAAGEDSIYGNYLPDLEAVMAEVVGKLEALRTEGKRADRDPIEHLLFRIKSEDSMREKLKRRGLEETTENALINGEITDAIGIRVVCPFLSDVYAIRDALVNGEGTELVQEKDYIRRAKPNGYRSLHMILRVRGFYVEVQLRTISMDTWAALEHQMKYKKDIRGNEERITRELKRCADELASTDVSMQTLRDMISGE